jgi:hypothetical protein
MHVQLEWAAPPAGPGAGAGPGAVCLSACHPALLHGEGEGAHTAAAGYDDIAVRDNMVYSGGKLSKPLSGARCGDDLASYLRSNEAAARSVSTSTGFNSGTNYTAL